MLQSPSPHTHSTEHLSSQLINPLSRFAQDQTRPEQDKALTGMWTSPVWTARELQTGAA